MYFESFAQLWSMDGHGAYVWSAYAIVWLVLTVLLRAPLVRRRQVLNRVRARLQLRRDGERQE